MSLVGTHVPTPQHRQPSPQHRQPSPQHHEPSHSQASISQNCVGSHCNQNNFLRRKREIVDAINSLANVGNIDENSGANARDIDEGNSRKKRDIIS